MSPIETVTKVQTTSNRDMPIYAFFVILPNFKVERSRTIFQLTRLKVIQEPIILILRYLYN